MKKARHFISIFFLSIICIVMAIVIAFNTGLLLDTTLDKEKAFASSFGYSPIIYGDEDSRFGFNQYDFLFVKNDVEVKENDVFAFIYGDVILLERAMEVDENGKATVFLLDETVTIAKEQIIGKVSHVNTWLGKFLLYIRTFWGMMAFVGIPCLLIILNELYGEKLPLYKDKFFNIIKRRKK